MDNRERAKYFKSSKIIAIDAGKNGGIAVYNKEEGRLIEAVKMPTTPQELLRFLRIYSNNSVCYLEKVQGLPGMAASAMFNFGKGFGQIEMALLSCKIPTYEVRPQEWIKKLSLGVKGGKSNTEWKNKLKTKAEQIFPDVKVTLAISDALLLCYYGILEERNK